MPAETAIIPDLNPGSYPGSPDLRTIVSTDGVTWLSFRKTLRPHYGRVWWDIAVCYVMVFGLLGLSCLSETYLGPWPTLALAPVLGLGMGYWLHSLACFGHEAAHHNLAGTRWVNNLIGNWLVMSFIGLEVKSYGRVHWLHHLHLGDHADSEISYHRHPSLWFLIESFTGIYVVRVMLRYRRTSANPRETPGKQRSQRQGGMLIGLVRAAVLHGSILGVLVWSGFYVAAVTWLAGVAGMIAFLTLRQIMEHRSVAASPSIDYSQIEHGPVNRMFPTSFWSRHFGNAGFNRHLLHHWDPAISYTNFDEMEAFLMQTNVASVLQAARTTYPQILLTFLRGGAR